MSTTNPVDPCCASCGSEAVVKSGHNSCGTQQYLCKVCGAHRVLSAKSRATEPARKAQILHALEVEYLSLREAERRFGIARQTIARWRKQRDSSVSGAQDGVCSSGLGSYRFAAPGDMLAARSQAA